MLILCEIESVSEVWLEYGVEEAGFEMGAEEFAVKGKVVLARSAAVAEVVGRLSSETLEEDKASEISLGSTILSIDSTCSLLSAWVWTLPFSRTVAS